MQLFSTLSSPAPCGGLPGARQVSHRELAAISSWFHFKQEEVQKSFLPTFFFTKLLSIKELLNIIMAK